MLEKVNTNDLMISTTEHNKRRVHLDVNSGYLWE